MHKSIGIAVLLVPLALNASTIIPTQLDSEHVKKRERAFEEWTDNKDQQAQFDKFLNQKGKFPILTERKDGQVEDHLYFEA